MFSVVVPTMWRGAQFAIMFPQILSSPAVGELIIINNDGANTPAGFANFQHPKLKIINHNRNTYVNPAWNIGVQHATYDQICLLSDDVMFDPGLFQQLESKVTPDIGLIGVWYNTIGKERSITKQHIACGLPVKLVEVTHHMPLLCFGCLMFLHKDNYFPVDMFRIFYGDYWQFIGNQKAGRKSYYMEGIQVCTQMTTTSSAKEFHSIADYEHGNAETLLDSAFGEGSYREQSVYSDMQAEMIADQMTKKSQKQISDDTNGRYETIV